MYGSFGTSITYDIFCLLLFCHISCSCITLGILGSGRALAQHLGRCVQLLFGNMTKS